MSEAQCPPPPMGTNVNGESQEKHHERHGIPLLPFHVAGVQVLLDEDASVYTLDHTVDEHDDGKDVRGEGVVGSYEAGEAKSCPSHDKGPRRLQEETEEGAVGSQPPSLEHSTLIVF